LRLSIVTTLYRSSETIDEFYRRSIAAAEPLFDDVEIVMVNDGSPDDSVERAVTIHEADPRVTVVDLSRNFGHHKAMMTGLSYASGDLVFLIDSDLEEPPELLQAFYDRFCKSDCDVVYGVQKRRRGGPLNRVGGAAFFRLAAALSDHPLPNNLIVARLMSRDYVRALVRHRDREFLIAYLWEIAGFRQVQIPVDKHVSSPTTYTFPNRLRMAIKHLTTTSTKLLYLILYAGITIFLFAVAVIFYFTVRYMTSGVGVSGFTSVIVSIWFFGGLTTLILGILGVYIANIFSETKRRPYTVVRRIYRQGRAVKPIAE